MNGATEKSESRRSSVLDVAEDPPFADAEGALLDELLKFSEVRHHTHPPAARPFMCLQKPLPSSLLKLDSNRTQDALKMHEYICTYMGFRPASLEAGQLVETASRLIKTCAKHPDLKNELYMQLIKQSRSVPLEEYRDRIWELWIVAASVFDPAKVNRPQGPLRDCTPVASP